MARRRGCKLKAVFSDGSIKRTVTEKGYTHAWRVVAVAQGDPIVLEGWAVGGENAAQAVETYANMTWSKLILAEVAEAQHIHR